MYNNRRSILLKLLVTLIFLTTQVQSDLSWCLPSDFIGVISTKQILSITMDAEYKPSDQSTLYLVGGMANQGIGNEAFLYSFFDGDGGCGLRHSYRIREMNLGIQGVTISSTYIWAIALATGKESIGISDKTNVLFRTSKTDPTQDLIAFRVDFKGTEAGSVGSRQTVLKMANFNDEQVVVQSQSEVRFINVAKNQVHGLYTFDMGDRFLQRDIYVAKNAASDQTQWNTYMAYPQYDYQRETLFILIDRVTVDSSLNLSNKVNIFRDLGQVNYNYKDYKTIRFVVNEESYQMAICTQFTFKDTDGSTQSKNMFVSVGLAGDIKEVRPVTVKIVDSAKGIQFECIAASFNNAGDTAYFLLHDTASNKKEVYSFGIVNNQLFKYQDIALPYTVSQMDQVYLGQRAVFILNGNFAMVNIDNSLNGKSMQNSYDVGYIIDSRAQKRINLILNLQETLIVLQSETNFLANPYPKSFLNFDKGLEKQIDSVTMTFSAFFNVLAKDVSMKKTWLNYFCPQSGQTGNFENLETKVGVSFEFKFQSVQKTVMEQTCYPLMLASFEAPLSKNNVVTESSLVLKQNSFKVLINDKRVLGYSHAIFGSVVSDAYMMDRKLEDTKFKKTTYVIFKKPTFNDLPFFITPIPDFSFSAGAAFSYTLPQIIDLQQPDQKVRVYLDRSKFSWLFVSEDFKRIYTISGLSGSQAVGEYVFKIFLNDGYLFGPNETFSTFKISISKRLSNRLPYFAAPGLKPQVFICEKAFSYLLPQLADDDGDQVNISLENSAIPWLRLSSDKTSLVVAAKATYGKSMIKTYNSVLILEDNSNFGYPRVANFTVSITIIAPVNKARPSFAKSLLVRSHIAVAEKFWSYKLPQIVSTDPTDVITIYLTDLKKIPGMKVDSQNQTIYLEKGAAYGNETLGLNPFSLVLDDGWPYGNNTVIYQMSITIKAPANTLPKFVNASSEFKTAKFMNIQGNSFFTRLPQVTDAETPSEKIQILLINTDCPWLTYDTFQKALTVQNGATEKVKIGNYTFQIVVKDQYVYGQGSLVYIATIRVVRSNKLPYFLPELPVTLTFRVGETWNYVLPTRFDPDGDKITLSFDKVKPIWLNYNRQKNSLFVSVKDIGKIKIGEYKLNILLNDGYPYGQNQVKFSTKIVIVSKYIMFKPTNEAPIFVSQLPDSQQQFKIGEPWELLLPKVFDPDGDPLTVLVVSKDTPFVKADLTKIYIEAGTTTSAQTNKYTVKIRLQDNPVKGADSLSTLYELELVGVNVELLEKLARSEPPPPQQGVLPFPRVKDIFPNGIVTIEFNNPISFPPNMIQKVNNYTESIIIEPGKPYFPKLNKFGFAEVPYIRMKILASQETIQEDLAYSWSMTSVTSMQMVFQINFSKPLKISQAVLPDIIELEFHIQEFVDINGKGVRDNYLISRELPRQIANDATAEQLAEAGDQVQTSTNYIMYLQIGVNILLNAAMDKVWVMVNGLQFIVVIPLIPVKFPGNAQLLMSAVVDIATFDLIPVQYVYPYIFDFKDSQPFNLLMASSGYPSAYIAENMGTNFLITHLLVVCLLLTGFFHLIRNKGPRFMRIANFLRRYFCWNFVIVFIFESYLEIALCTVSVIKRWLYNHTLSWDPQGNFNNNSNLAYAVLYLCFVISYPIFLLVLYCVKKKDLDKERFQSYLGGPYHGMKRLHRNRKIIYCTVFLVRRLIFVFTIIIFEEQLFAALFSSLFITEMGAIFIINQLPFYEPTRNWKEFFNEVCILTMIMMTLCFTEVMEPEAQQTIGWYFIAIIILYIVVHFSFLMSDTVRKICLLIWLQLARCRWGKQLQIRIKRQAILAIRKYRGIVDKPVDQPPPVDSVDSSVSLSVVQPDSSLSMEEYEHVINQYRQRAEQDEDESTERNNNQSSAQASAHLVKNLLIIQRNHHIEDPLEQEMNFWMSEIERLDHINEGSVTQRARQAPQPIDLEQANLNNLIFVPEDWMQDQDQEMNDNAFESMVEVNSLNNTQPVFVKRRQKNRNQVLDPIIPPPTESPEQVPNVPQNQLQRKQLPRENSAKPDDIENLLNI